MRAGPRAGPRCPGAVAAVTVVVVGTAEAVGEADVAVGEVAVVAAEADVPVDRFGVTWQPALAAGILAHLDRIDIVEVIAEDYCAAPARAARALETLATQVPLLVHGVALGPASATPVDRRRLDALARLVERVNPESWSEHLACVRSGGIEIGHLAAAPRTHRRSTHPANLARAAAVVGTRPLVENIATLMDAPASARHEAVWVSGVIAASGCDLLSISTTCMPTASTSGSIPSTTSTHWTPPASAVFIWPAAVGLTPSTRTAAPPDDAWLDDHLHDVPDPVYALLVEVGARARKPLTVVLERDGRFPPMTHLFVAAPSRQEGAGGGALTPRAMRPEFKNVSCAALHRRGHAKPVHRRSAYRGGAQQSDRRRVRVAGRIDRIGLELSARSFAHKRALKTAGRRRPWWRRRSDDGLQHHGRYRAASKSCG